MRNSDGRFKVNIKVTSRTYNCMYYCSNIIIYTSSLSLNENYKQYHLHQLSMSYRGAFLDGTTKYLT